MWTALQRLGQEYGFSTVWGRIFTPYGPGDSPERLVFSVINALRSGRSVEVSDGRQVRDFIHIDDVADLLCQLLLADIPGVFNVGSGQGTSVREVVTTLATALNQAANIRFGARPRYPGEPSKLVADKTKVRAALGWKPRIALMDGLASCLSASLAPVASRVGRR